MARRLTASAKISGAMNETLVPTYGQPHSARARFFQTHQPQNVLPMECRWGGECRVERDVMVT
jgi:hypothetical protein